MDDHEGRDENRFKHLLQPIRCATHRLGQIHEGQLCQLPRFARLSHKKPSPFRAPSGDARAAAAAATVDAAASVPWPMHIGGEGEPHTRKPARAGGAMGLSSAVVWAAECQEGTPSLSDAQQ